MVENSALFGLQQGEALATLRLENTASIIPDMTAGLGVVLTGRGGVQGAIPPISSCCLVWPNSRCFVSVQRP